MKKYFEKFMIWLVELFPPGHLHAACEREIRNDRETGDKILHEKCRCGAERWITWEQVGEWAKVG
jgi:hypothetical protein